MPTLIQRAETFEINAQNPVARALVRELRLEVLRLERELAATSAAVVEHVARAQTICDDRAAAEPHVRPPGSG